MFFASSIAVSCVPTPSGRGLGRGLSGAPSSALTPALSQKGDGTLLSLQQINKQRRTDQRGDRADRQFARRDDRAGNRVGNYDKRRARQSRRDNHQTVVAPETQAHQQRHDQSDRSDRSAR